MSFHDWQRSNVSAVHCSQTDVQCDAVPHNMRLPFDVVALFAAVMTDGGVSMVEAQGPLCGNHRPQDWVRANDLLGHGRDAHPFPLAYDGCCGPSNCH